MNVLEFEVDPVPKARPRLTTSGIAYTPKKTREYEAYLAKCARLMWRNKPLSKAIRLKVEFVIKRPKSVSAKKRPDHTVKPDLDNLIKCLDSFNKILWLDDSQIISIEARKIYGAKGRLVLYFEELQ